MLLKDIIQFIDNKIPKSLALPNDNIGFQGDYDVSCEISSVKILMDFYPQNDNFSKNTLIITHHPPLFKPKTPTYTIHSNWDIIDGGANDALAENLNLNVLDVFDKNTGIGRVCRCDSSFSEFKENVLKNFKSARVVSEPAGDWLIEKVGIVSGFGLKNPEYIKLANRLKLDVLISGDLTQETAVLGKNLNQCLIDLGHHESEVPGLYKLSEVIQKTGVKCEVINEIPITRL